MDQFEAYFKRADLNQDGRISGAEAVAFFQGSSLSKQVLAQIWTHADQNRSGFLGRPEFFNALKLVTVAQSKRDLTPEIVRAALYGPASSKIPPPQINLPPSPMPQPSAVSTSLPMQMGAMTPSTSQNLGYRGSLPPNQNMNQQYFPSPGNQLIRPSQGLPTSPAPHPGQSTPGFPNSGISSAGFPNSGMLTPGLSSSGTSTPGQPNPSVSAGWLGGRPNGHPSGPTSQVPNRPPISQVSPQPQFPSQSANNDSRVIAVSGNGFSSNSIGGSDPFADFQTITTPAASASTPSLPSSSAIVPVSGFSPASSIPISSAIVPISYGTPPTSTSSSLDSLQSAFAKQPFGGQPHQAQAFSSLPQPVPPVTSSGVSPGNLAGAGNSIPDQPQPPWPKMTTPGVQKYTKVFMEVDTDRDGKVTGVQARDLFLSWRLPREVLKQVWDLADQDNDSMLSLREFCIALYLMERYREGRPLPASIPNSIMFDETLMRMTGLPHSSHGSTAWGATSGAGFRPVHGGSAPQTMAPTASPRPVMHSAPHTNRTVQFQEQKSNLLVPDNNQVNLNSEDRVNLLQPTPPEINDTEKKVEKVEKVILDSREKLEFYRTKMQELVLYKSRCDNRLNEIIERANADKREADILGKKYEEKYKQVAEIASKLTIEEARFREYQERKMELQQAITNMEQGGSADGILQVRADRIQSDLEELVKALSERSMKHGIEIKSAALIELPKGWQAGIQEEASVWDEEWDKFDDEGLLFDKEINADAQNLNGSPKSTLFQNGIHSHDERFSPESSSFLDGQSEKQSSKGEHTFDGESRYTHSEDESARSPHGSPPHRAAPESPSRDFSDVFAKSSEADTEFNRSFDDQGWGTFDGTDDAESVWGFNSKDLGLDQHHGDHGVFDSSSFGLSPRNESPQQGDNTFNKRSPFNFADSVPGTPTFSKSGNSPRYSDTGDGFFDNYSRFDSFSMSDSTRFSPPRETLTRFDSTNSSKGAFDQSRRFTSFDDADPFGSTGPFKVSSETPRKGSDNWSSF